MSDTETTATTDGAGSIPGAGSGTGTQPATPAADRTFTQSELNALLAEDRRKAKQAADAETARAKAAAAEAAAASAGEWQSVAEQRKAAAEAAEARADAVQAERDALALEVEEEIKPRLRALPLELRELMPADGTSAQRLAAVRKLEAAAVKLGSMAAAAPQRGSPPGPRGIGGLAAPVSTAQADLIAEKRARYGGL